jgi:hypothetical protein
VLVAPYTLACGPATAPRMHDVSANGTEYRSQRPFGAASSYGDARRFRAAAATSPEPNFASGPRDPVTPQTLLQ